MRRAVIAIIALVVIGAVGFAAFATFWGVPSVEARPTSTDQSVIEQGRYLAAAGDCAACHTDDQNGPELAGGLGIDTPFGTIYSSNITPANGSGIGGMTSAQFYQIMAYGADSVWAPLYPAMPYTSFHFVTRDDSDAIHAFLMSLDPVDRAPPPNELGFPFNIRPMMFGWNLLFASRQPFAPEPEKDDVWNRGAYLTQGLGHCAECHTPRNSLGAMNASTGMSGAIVGDFEAPDIRPAALAERGWNADHLVTYFESGATPQGTAFGEMFLVVKDSLSKLTHDDQVAIATYLMDTAAADPSHGDTVVASLGDDAHPNTSGQSLYLSNCALCHGPTGLGQQNVMPALVGNSTVAQANGVNLVRVIAQGLEAQSTSQTSGYGPMPAYADRLDVAQLTDLVNYVRSAFGPENAPLPQLTESDVRGALPSP